MISIILLSVLGLVTLFMGFNKNQKVLMPAVLFFLAAVLVANLVDWNQSQTYFNNMMTIDNFAVAFTAVVVVSTMLLIPFSRRYQDQLDPHLAEYYALLLFALVGAMMIVSYEHLLMLFIGIEILSISSYVLAGADKTNVRSNEASLKYFLMGAFATGILLFGFALVYGATRTFYIAEIAAAGVAAGTFSPMLGMGLLFILIGIGFKVSAAPFHFWTPDVYEGSPTFFTMFISTVVKTAGFAGFYKLLAVSFSGVYSFWYPTLLGMTVLTLIIGNIGAVTQGSVKRMLAYSSISHAGYLMIALVAFNVRSVNAIIFYSLAYSVATIASFGILKLVADQRNGDESYEAFNGLARTNPMLAVVMTISMCSLAGIPLTAGFFGKLFIFTAAFDTTLDRPLLWLIVLAILLATVGIYYYFRVVIAMFMKEPVGGVPTAVVVPAKVPVQLYGEEHRMGQGTALAEVEVLQEEEEVIPQAYPAIQVDGLTQLALLLTAIITVVLGVVPGLVSGLL
ncbi:NADH-quinone oxidoreductase subunit N [soil metagenome]